MKLRILETIQQLFERSCIELFDSFHCEIHREFKQVPDTSGCPVGVITASSHDIEICVFIQIPYSALASSYPVIDNNCDIDDKELEDWLMEISNQLIGRFKNKLDRHKCHAQMGLPDCQLGIDVDSCIPENSERFDEYFSLDNTLFSTSICVRFLNDKPSFSLDEINDADVMEEGDIELF